jgi:hypothetical protein
MVQSEEGKIDQWRMEVMNPGSIPGISKKLTLHDIPVSVPTIPIPQYDTSEDPARLQVCFVWQALPKASRKE